MNFLDDRLPDRFWAKCALKPSGCWLWLAGTNSFGYGKFSFGGHDQRAHRVAYQTLVGDVPDGLQLDHKCRERSCVNPAHLEPVTPGENVRRGQLGDVTRARHQAVTQCPSGHVYDEANTRRYRGSRYCRACANIRSNDYYARKSAKL